MPPAGDEGITEHLLRKHFQNADAIGHARRFAGSAIPGRKSADEAEAAVRGQDGRAEAGGSAAEEEAELALCEAAASCWVYH